MPLTLASATAEQSNQAQPQGLNKRVDLSKGSKFYDRVTVYITVNTPDPSEFDPRQINTDDWMFWVPCYTAIRSTIDSWCAEYYGSTPYEMVEFDVQEAPREIAELDYEF